MNLSFPLCLLGILTPISWALLWYTTAISSLHDNYATFSQACHTIHQILIHQATNRQIMSSWKQTDATFVHREIAQQAWLTDEITAIHDTQTRSALPEDGSYLKRLQFLTSENTCCFSESAPETAPWFIETVLSQTKPVELSRADLQQLLNLIEAPHPSKPHLIILESEIEKKKGLISEVWSTSFQLLQREYPS